jgi:hypothetical protein
MMSNYRTIKTTDLSFNWVISQMQCFPSYEGEKDFVVYVHWRRNATFEEYVADVYGCQTYSQKEGDTYIPYSDLTFDIVCGWLESSLDVPALDINLAKQIEDLVNPPVITLPLPWEPEPVPPTE